jgi:putative membrane protein
MHRFAGAVAGATIASVLAFSIPAQAANTPPVPFPEADFVLKASQINTEEITLGELARKEGKESDVRMFGQHMVKDHSKAQNDLVKIASDKGIPLPTKAVNRIVRTERNILASRPAQQFDLEYILQQVGGHELSLTLFQFAANNASDPKIKDYAKKYEPVIEEHLKEARSILEQLSK